MSPTGPNKYLRGITPIQKQINWNLICFKSKSQKIAWKSLEKNFLAKGNKSYKRRSSLTKLKLDLFKPKYIQTPIFNSMSQKVAEKNPGNWILAKANNYCKSRPSVTKPNFIFIMSWQIHASNFKSKSPKTAEKSLENWISAKGNNSCKSRSGVTKLLLNLYYVMTNSYTKFQVNISKDSREKSGKLNFSKGQ